MKPEITIVILFVALGVASFISGYLVGTKNGQRLANGYKTLKETIRGL